MKYIFICLTFFVAVAQAQEPRPENRQETTITTALTIDDKGYLVRWDVAMVADPSETQLFKKCAGEIRDILISRVIQLSVASHRIGRLQNSLRTTCSQAWIGFEANPSTVVAE